MKLNMNGKHMKVDKQLSAISMRRSGHHAIIEWIINHVGHTEFINNYPKADRYEYNQDSTGTSYRITNYEDYPIQEALEHIGSEGKILLILRDPYNMFASRLRSKFLTEEGRISPRIIHRWKDHATEFLRHSEQIDDHRLISISFNMWIKDKEYRDNIAKQIGFTNTDKGINILSQFGQGSSFDGNDYQDKANKMDLQNRHKQVMHETIFRQLCQNQDIAQLAQHLPGPNQPKEQSKSDNAVVSICIGDAHNQIFAASRNTLSDYAKRIGADFKVISDQKISTSSPHYEKFQLYEILTRYRRVIYLDCDVIVRDDCPNLLEIVPEDRLGIFNEGLFKDHSAILASAAKVYNMSLKEFKGDYYNTGVMVLSRIHRDLFEKPIVEDIFNHFEQSYLNLLILNKHVRTYELTHKFNRMKDADGYTGRHRLDSYIVHYAGILNNAPNIIKQDLDLWKQGHKNYPTRVALGAGARLGDMICAEPVIRHMIQKKFDDDTEIAIISSEPRIFAHLSDRATIMTFDQFKPHPDMPYISYDCMPEPHNPIWKKMDCGSMHTVDFMSIICMKHTLPNAEKRIKLAVTLDDYAEVLDIMPLPDNLVVIHPGKGWESKTFPKEYWDEIIKMISAEGYQVAVIGKQTEKGFGTVDVDIPDGVHDLRELLSLGGLFALLSKANTLVSNDSAPIHVAGAFDNNIILLPTCKHPDFVLPHRPGLNKSVALFRKPMWEEPTFNPMRLYGHDIEHVPKGQDITKYLPDPEYVLKTLKEFICGQ